MAPRPKTASSAHKANKRKAAEMSASKLKHKKTSLPSEKTPTTARVPGVDEPSQGHHHALDQTDEDMDSWPRTTFSTLQEDVQVFEIEKNEGQCTGQMAISFEETPEAELERLSAKWISPVYALYDKEVKVKHFEGRRYHEFKCIGTNCNHRIRRYLDTSDTMSIGNLHKHAKACWGEEAVKMVTAAQDAAEARNHIIQPLLKEGPKPAVFERKGKGKVTSSTVARQYTKAELRAECVRWVCENAHPFSIVEDQGFKNLMRTGRSEIYIPSAKTVAHDTKLVFANCRLSIAQLLQEHEGKLSFGVDVWTSPNRCALVCVTVHLEKNGTPLVFVLDIMKVAVSHTGADLATAVAAISKDFKIEDKILGVTCDSTSNNDMMVNELANRLPTFPGASNRSSCFLHIINLVEKSLLKQFDVPKKKADNVKKEADDVPKNGADSDLDDHEFELKDEGTEAGGNGSEKDWGDEGAEAEDHLEGWVDEMMEMNSVQRKEFKSWVQPVRLVVVKELARQALHSKALLPKWLENLCDLKLNKGDITICWKSTYEILDFGLEYKLGLEENRSDQWLGLQKNELSGDEWRIAQQLHDVLKILKDAQKFFSRQTPLLATVIPAMDYIEQFFVAAANNQDYELSLLASVYVARMTLNRYYNVTDWPEAYRIAMVLHPRHKLTYFRSVQWDSECIKAAKEITLNEYNRSYAHIPVERLPSETAVPPPPPTNPSNIFDQLPVFAPLKEPEDEDEVEAYLATPVEYTDDPFRWWTDRKERFPRLSRMALDYLCIPATSMDADQVFTNSWEILPYHYNRTSIQSIQAQLCLGSWIRAGMVKDEDIMSVARKPEDGNK